MAQERDLLPSPAATVREKGARERAACQDELSARPQVVESLPAAGSLGALWLKLLKAKLPPPEPASQMALLLECTQRTQKEGRSMRHFGERGCSCDRERRAPMHRFGDGG